MTNEVEYPPKPWTIGQEHVIGLVTKVYVGNDVWKNKAAGQHERRISELEAQVNGLTVAEAINLTDIEKMLGSRVWLTDRQAWFKVVLASTFTGGNAVGRDELTSSIDSNYGLKLEYAERVLAVSLGLQTGVGNDNSGCLRRLKELALPVKLPAGVIESALPVCDNEVFPVGIDWEGTELHVATDTSSATELRYTGPDKLFDIKEPNGTASTGGGRFAKIRFTTTQAGASIFEFNDPSQVPTDNNTTANYIRNIKYEGVTAFGAGGAGSRFISGTKVFELVTDENCEVRGFERGVYLYGSDNNTIDGRYYLNGRNVMIESAGTFGNQNKVASRFLGTPVAYGETAYCLWDTGFATNVVGTGLEDVNGVSEAMCYIGGKGTRFYGVEFGSNGLPPFRLATTARDVVINGGESTGALLAPIVELPIQIDTAVTLGNYPGVTLVDCSNRLETVCLQSQRVRTSKTAALGFDITNFIGSEVNHGISFSIKKLTMTVANYYGKSSGAGWSGAPSFIPDATSRYGAAINLQAVHNHGYQVDLVVGKQVANGSRIKIDVSYKMGASITTGSYRYIIKRNGVSVANNAIPVALSYTLFSVYYDVSQFDWSNDDVLSVGIYNANVTETALRVERLVIEAVTDEVPDTTGATLAELETSVNELKNQLRKANILG